MSRVRWLAISLLCVFAPTPSPSAAQGAEVTYPSVAEGLFRVARVIDEGEDRDTRADEVRYVRLLPQGRGRVEVVSISDVGQALQSSVRREPERRTWYFEAVEGSRVPNVCVALGVDGQFECGRLRMNAPHRDFWLYAATDQFARPSVMLIRMR